MPEKSYLLKGGEVFQNGEFRSSDILVVGSGIEKIAPRLSPPPSATEIDCRGAKVCPGFIDIHCHGAMGKDMMDGAEAVLEVARFKAGQGTTGFLPTIITNPMEMMRWAALESKRAMETPENPGAKILGVHIEGPFVNPRYRGAQPEDAVKVPNLYETQQMLTELGDALKMFTIAPEMPNAEQVTRLLGKHNVIGAAGHSDCTRHQMIQAIGWGIQHLTHTFNAMRGIHHREPGMLAAALDSDKVSCDFICDLIHVHEWVLRFFMRAKSIEKCILITDAISAAGMPEGEYTLGGQYVIVEGRAPRLIDGRLAGSVLTMIRGVRNLAEKVGIGLPAAIRMASENPAKLLGLFEKKGSLEEGKDADICVLDNRFRVVRTFVEGKMVYHPAEEN